jgi:hypothetical protein
MAIEETAVTRENLARTLLTVENKINAVAPNVTRNQSDLFDVRGKKEEDPANAKQGYEALSATYPVFRKRLTKVDDAFFSAL